jgi:hypothetical protein
VKLLTRLILLLITFYNPAFAEVIKNDDGLIGLTGKDSLYAVENGVVLSSDSDASTRSDFNFVLLFDKRVWHCDYLSPDGRNDQAWFYCLSRQNEIIDSSF